MQVLFLRDCRDFGFVATSVKESGDSALDIFTRFFLAVKMLNDLYVEEIIHHDVNNPMSKIVFGKPIHCLDPLLQMGETPYRPPVRRLTVGIAK